MDAIEEPILDRLLDPITAARLLGVTPRTLQDWRSTQRTLLPYVRIGGRVHYRRSTLEQFVAQHTVAG
jgi:hypothetical protein